MVSRVQFCESSFLKCTWRQTEVVIIQATVPIMWLLCHGGIFGCVIMLQFNKSLLPLGIFSIGG